MQLRTLFDLYVFMCTCFKVACHTTMRARIPRLPERRGLSAFYRTGNVCLVSDFVAGVGDHDGGPDHLRGSIFMSVCFNTCMPSHAQVSALADISTCRHLQLALTCTFAFSRPLRCHVRRSSEPAEDTDEFGRSDRPERFHEIPAVVPSSTRTRWKARRRRPQRTVSRPFAAVAGARSAVQNAPADGVPTTTHGSARPLRGPAVP